MTKSFGRKFQNHGIFPQLSLFKEKLRAMVSKHSEFRSNRVRNEELAVSGPEGRFWQFWREHEPFLMQLCKGWLRGTPLDAREELSSAMLKAWEGSARMPEEIGNYKAWLARIVRNHCIDQQRKLSKDKQLTADPEQLMPAIERNGALHQASGEVVLLKDESYQGLLAKMERLPIRLREVMMLRAYQNMSYREIGIHLRISSENARKRVQMARNLLRMEEGDQAQGNFQPEQAAADAILGEERSLAGGAMRFAMPVKFVHDGQEIELVVLHGQRPVRLRQKAQTLHRYLQRHPGGWKKELEYAQICWGLGEGKQALERIQRILDRNAQNTDAVLVALGMLHDLGDREAILSLASHALDLPASAQTASLLSGFMAEANGEPEKAEQHWKCSETDLGEILLAKMWLRTGQMAKAKEALRRQLRLHPMDRARHFLYGLALDDLSEAQDAAALAVRRFPNDPFALSQFLVSSAIQDTDHRDAQQSGMLLLRKLVRGSFLALATEVALLQIGGESAAAERLASDFCARHPRHLQAAKLLEDLVAHHNGSRQQSWPRSDISQDSQSALLRFSWAEMGKRFLR